MSTVSPKLATWLADLNQSVAALQANGFQPSVINMREALANLTRAYVSGGPPIAWVNDAVVAGPGYAVPVRIYHPAPREARPVLLYYHGGGHMVGSVSVYDPICRRLAAACGQIVVAPEYRLAPECPYPAGLEDALAVARGVWDALTRRGLPFLRELTVAGDSAGGALAASVSAVAQHGCALAVAQQVLIYPSLDYTMQQPSIATLGDGYFLTRERIAWYFEHYFRPGVDRRAASPLYQEISPGLPRTLLISAGCDPLRDEAAAYAARLQAAGVPVERRLFDDMLHAFLNLEALVGDECAAVYRAIGEFVQG